MQSQKIAEDGNEGTFTGKMRSFPSYLITLNNLLIILFSDKQLVRNVTDLFTGKPFFLLHSWYDNVAIPIAKNALNQAINRSNSEGNALTIRQRRFTDVFFIII